MLAKLSSALWPEKMRNVTQEIRVGGTDLRLRRRQLKAVFPQLFEQSRNGEDVSGGIRIEHDNVNEVVGHVNKAFDDSVDHLDELSRCRAAPLWHPCGMTSDSKRRVGVQNAVREIVPL